MADDISEHPKMLKQTILELISDMKTNVFIDNKEQADFAEIEFFFNSMHEYDVMNHCIKELLPIKNVIQKGTLLFEQLQADPKKKLTKEEKIFVYDNFNILFDRLQKDEREYYKKILHNKKRVKISDIKCWFEFLIVAFTLTEQYKKFN